MKRYIFAVFFILLCFSGCKEDAEMPERGYYILTTKTPEIKSNEITFYADVEGISDEEIIEWGFYITRSYSQSHYDDLGGHYPAPLNGNFELTLAGDWVPETTCSVYAYIKTATKNYIGDKLNFNPMGSSPPEIESVTHYLEDVGWDYNPDAKSHAILIKGENFSRVFYRNKVLIGETEMYLLETSETELKVEGYYLTEGYHNVTVSVASYSTTLNNGYYQPGPVITSIEPQNPQPWSTVTLCWEEPEEHAYVGGYYAFEFLIVNDETQERYYPIELSREKGKIVFLYPEITGEATINLQSSYIYAQPFKVYGTNSWKEVANSTYPSSYYSSFTVYQNIGYMHDSKYIYQYFINNNNWQKIELPFNPNNNFSGGYVFFPYKDDLYIIRHYDSSIYRYNISTQTWNVCNEKTPMNNAYYLWGIVLDGDLYASQWTDQQSAFFKYSIEDDKLTEFSASKSFHNLSIFNYNSNLYYLNTNMIYKIDKDDWQYLGKVEAQMDFNFGLYSGRVAVKDDIVYIATDGLLWKYDFITKKFSSLGIPNRGNNIELIFPLDNKLIVGCNGSLYEYQE